MRCTQNCKILLLFHTYKLIHTESISMLELNIIQIQSFIEITLKYLSAFNDVLNIYEKTQLFLTGTGR
jgi:hypothetical protein